MRTLRLTVEWLDDAYHGREWPPSPLRLYQALLAGAAAHRRGDAGLEAALRHLETLPAPVVTAPSAESARAVTASVANNDGDAVVALLAKGQQAQARKLRERSVTLRTRRALRFDGPITYDWAAGPETAGHFAAIAAMAGAVSAVGLGIDVALARATLLARPGPVRGVRHAPAARARRRLDVPWPGAFDALERRYRAERGRIAGGSVAAVPEPERRSVAYRSALDPPGLRSAAFALRRPDETPFALEGARAMEVAAMVRHALGRVARRAGLDADTRAALMGHGAEAGRLWVQPLASVGHRHADGRIRRVMLVAADGVDEAHWTDVVVRLLGEALIPARARTAVALLAPVADADPVLARYRGVAAQWTTATPVVLPGHDHRRGKPRPRRAVERLLRHAGIAEALVASVRMEPAPRLAGSDGARRYRRPAHLARYPVQHLSVRWTTPLAGPLALGAGTGYGLGLLVPVPDRGDARLPGAREWT